MVSRVNDLGKRQKQKKVKGNFKYSLNNEDTHVEELEEDDESAGIPEEAEEEGTEVANGHGASLSTIVPWEPTYVGEGEYNVSNEVSHANDDQSANVNSNRYENEATRAVYQDDYVPVYQGIMRKDSVEQNTSVQNHDESQEDDTMKVYNNNDPNPTGADQSEDSISIGTPNTGTVPNKEQDTSDYGIEVETTKDVSNTLKAYKNNDLDSDLSIDSSADELDTDIKDKTHNEEIEEDIIFDEVEPTRKNVTEGKRIYADEETATEDDWNHGETTTKSGRSVKRINYKDFASYGSQYAQIGSTKVRKHGDEKMFKRVTELTMLHLSKESEYDQLGVKEGIEKHGEKAIAAIIAEYQQLKDMDTVEVIDPDSISKKQKDGALELLTMVKKKRCGKVKGRACANGKKQRSYIKKEDVTSPTVSLDSLLLSLAIDAMEGRDVATADVAGAYLKTKMEDLVIVKVKGKSADMMMQVNPNFKGYETQEYGNKVIYMKLKKALYGCMQSALLWYETFKGYLEQEGFVLNKYDPCIANKDIQGSQCTIAWYVDDSKISHKNSEVVTRMINKLEDKFEKMSVTRGSKHTFVGMGLTFNKDGTVTIDMNDYIKECIETSGKQFNGGATTPAKRNLFEIDESAHQLSKNQKEIFHHIVAKLLFVSKRARPDIDLTISFLCSRVDRSTTEDWQKLERLLHYLNGSMELNRTIGLNQGLLLRTWVDASYGTHANKRGHTGGIISGGRGILHHKSSKQKLNTKSSTETEVVGASDYLSYTVWTKKFFQEQGYKIKRSIYYQDNESAIKLESNGWRSKGERSRHIDIRYFFICDVLKREKIQLMHCHTERMIADYFTKPL